MTMKYVALAFAALALCATALPAAAKDPVLYTSNSVQVVEAAQASIKEKSGINLGVVTGGSGVLMRRIEAEAQAPQGDLYWSASAGTLSAYEKFFEPYSSPELSAVPQDLHYAGDLFQPTNIHLVTFMVNTDMLNGDEAPKSWSDLADPKWKGRVILADPANAASGYAIAWGLSKLLDEATYKAVVANLVITGSSSEVQKGVAAGEYAVGLALEWAAYSYVDGGQDNISIVYPSDGTFRLVDYAGIVKGGPSTADARKAMDVLLSKEAQVEQLKLAFRRPSRGDIEISQYVKLPEMSAIKVFATDDIEASKSREQFLADWAKLTSAN
jgi:iron(III) transport system substrate-binding protein